MAGSSRVVRRRSTPLGRRLLGPLGVSLVGAACLVCLMPIPAARADATTLFGVGGFRVDVSALSPATRRLGFSEVGLHRLVQGHLRRNGLNAGDFPSRLSIALRVVEHPTAVLAYSLELQVQQIVRLSRTEQIQLMAPTWTEGRLTLVPRAGLRRSVEGALSELCDALGRDYRSVNA